jgi:hypothetical protein
MDQIQFEKHRNSRPDKINRNISQKPGSGCNNNERFQNIFIIETGLQTYPYRIKYGFMKLVDSYLWSYCFNTVWQKFERAMYFCTCSLDRKLKCIGNNLWRNKYRYTPKERSPGRTKFDRNKIQWGGSKGIVRCGVPSLCIKREHCLFYSTRLYTICNIYSHIHINLRKCSNCMQNKYNFWFLQCRPT